MDDKRFRRFGWFDSEGPLWFLKERWRSGQRWRRVEVRFFAGPTGITLQAHTVKGGWAIGGEFAEFALWEDLSYGQKEQLIMSWLRRIVNPASLPGGGSAAVDHDWVRDLPALHDYMALRTDADGQPRRTSTLTLFADGGSWKAYLNDRDTGASLCASGSSIAATLSALEAMLEAEDTPWRFSDRPNPGQNGKARKRP